MERSANGEINKPKTSGLKVALKEAAWVFGLSRLMIVITSYIGLIEFPLDKLGYSECIKFQGQFCLEAWYHWDAFAFVRIATDGYTFVPDVGFFPLWPSLIKLGGLALGGFNPLSYYFAGVLLANIFFFGALVLLYLLLNTECGPAIARRSIFYLTFYAYALYFFVGYTESLFLLLTCASFLLLRRGRTYDWWLVGLLGLCAVLTRSTGIALAVPYLVVYLQRFWPTKVPWREQLLSKVNALTPLLLLPAGLLTYMGYLWATMGDPFIVSQQESLFWQRRLAPPWESLGGAIGALFTHPFFSGLVYQNLLDLIFTILPLIVLALGWKRLPLQYSLFALALAFFAMSFPMATGESLASQPRYMMMMFPIFIIMAYWSKHRWFDRAFVALSIPFFTLNVILFVTHHWVA